MACDDFSESVVESLALFVENKSVCIPAWRMHATHHNRMHVQVELKIPVRHTIIGLSDSIDCSIIAIEMYYIAIQYLLLYITIVSFPGLASCLSRVQSEHV